MHVELLLVGAHSGQKQQNLIMQAATRGAVILIEPVPYLFAMLTGTYGKIPNITCLNRCVAPTSGKLRFYAPTEEAIKVFPWGDQLGSMNLSHAIQHEPALAAHIVEIEADAVTFAELVDQFEIRSLQVLLTDTEGYDARLLLHFPFVRLRPTQIIFEYKHSDGTFNIGRNLGHLLILLDEAGYNIRTLDQENCLATRRSAL